MYYLNYGLKFVLYSDVLMCDFLQGLQGPVRINNNLLKKHLIIVHICK